MAVSYKNRIRFLRKKLKMTQEQMAEQLFIDQNTLSCMNVETEISQLVFLWNYRRLMAFPWIICSVKAILPFWTMSLSAPRQRSLSTV